MTVTRIASTWGVILGAGLILVALLLFRVMPYVNDEIFGNREIRNRRAFVFWGPVFVAIMGAITLITYSLRAF